MNRFTFHVLFKRIEPCSFVETDTDSTVSELGALFGRRLHLIMIDTAVVDVQSSKLDHKEHQARVSINSDDPSKSEKKKVNLTKKLKEECRRLRIENEIFNRYMTKVGANKFYPAPRAAVPASTEAFSTGSRARSRIYAQVSDIPTFSLSGRLVQLSAERKCMIAQCEQVEFKKDLTSLIDSCENILDELRASVEKFRLLEENAIRERKAFEKNVSALVVDSKQCRNVHRAFVWFHQAYLKRMDLC
ncbi:hypothetical protein EG68_11632 [Paragonimus skrjabini miyazakii]|uniref:Uncharacterized protein n=1 Tax=Paragonimus skrjabini miyazakii TaxID=59628 RepID=A0A8S9YJI1_9TREM|nr:hypothetical protein EG68_11632 [Paragonimus skrjabini miyazakii]